MKIKFLLYLSIVFFSFSSAFATCYDNINLVWKNNNNKADLIFTNNSNRSVIISKIYFFDLNSNLLFHTDTNIFIGNNAKIIKNIYSNKLSSAHTANYDCKFASSYLNSKSNNSFGSNSNNSNKSGFDSNQILIFLLPLIFIGFILFLISKSKSKKFNIKINNKTVINKNLKSQNKKLENKNEKTPVYKKLIIATVGAPIAVNIPSLSNGMGISKLTFPILIGMIFWTLVAYSSHKSSKVVSNKIKKEISKTMDTKPDTSKSLKEVVHDKIQDNKEKEKQVLKEDEIYDQIGREIEEDKKIRSVWTKALAQADGDVNKAESQYIKIRFDQLNK